jgi:hypothetical protein
MIYLQIDVLCASSRDRVCPRVLSLMYPSRTRESLSIHQTGNAAA